MSDPGRVYRHFHRSAPSHGPGLPTTAGLGLRFVCYCAWWKPCQAAYADFSLCQQQGRSLLRWPVADLRLLAPLCSWLPS
ncbi:MAG: hypothetical protein K0Q83_574 [Deltaproteobacteria bacterium]|nr:hypothetical protein [Deltaproteobacteria bacterium]